MSEYEFPADVPTKPFFEEVTAIYGGRSSGKTYRAKELIGEHKPPQVVWIDPTLDVPTNLLDMQKQIEAKKRMIQVSATHPDIAIAAMLVAYAMSTKDRPIFVVCDEAATYLKVPRPSLARVFNMGRHAGMGVLLITQRPSGVHPDYRGQAATTLWGRLTDHNDVVLAQKALGMEQGRSRQNAQTGDFIKN